MSRLTPLASGLAIALAIGCGTTTAIQAKPLADYPSMSTMIDRHRQGSAPLLAASWRKPMDPASVKVRHPVSVPLQHVPAGAIPVTNCNDDGAGSLRDIVDNVAVSGDTIDLTNTGCSTITLTTGDIIMDQDDLDLLGPGFAALSIDGSNLYSVRHVGSGTLSIYDLAIINGRKYLDATTNLNANGGCIYSSGTLSLSNSEVKYCSASTANTMYIAKGGAVYGKAGVLLSNSTVVLGEAGGATGYGLGGGIYSPGSVVMVDSFIASNSALFGGGVIGIGGTVSKYSSIVGNQASQGGGAYLLGNAFIENSTIAGNEAQIGGGLWMNGNGATTPITLVNSTVSGNSAQLVGGVIVTGYPGRIANSTIAFNTEANAADQKYGAGLYVAAPVQLESNIIAQNSLNHSTSGLVADDIGGSPDDEMSGANNLAIFVLPGLFAPADTLYADPLLNALGDNGGSTSTHSLNPSSPAIEAGNNAGGFSVDQRGAGFPRVIGANADIGAVEFDTNDVIFANGFD
jgi:hypothetical protein